LVIRIVPGATLETVIETSSTSQPDRARRSSESNS
jgi:hypothetical protein